MNLCLVICLKSIFFNKLGFGAYRLNKNSIMGGSSVPLIRNSRTGVIIRHKEYIGDIHPSVVFQNQLASAINPGNFNLFPWLSGIANKFEEYEFRGLIFKFKTMSSDTVLATGANTSLGTVMMGTEYDVLDSPFASKVELLNHQYSSSCKPSENMTHPIECARGKNVATHLFVRDYTALPDLNQTGDPRLYDLGRFQVATQGMQAGLTPSQNTLGEIWVSYEVQFWLPKLPEGNDTINQYRAQAQTQQNILFKVSEPLGPIYDRVAANYIPAFTGPNPIITFVDATTGLLAPARDRFWFNASAPNGFYMVMLRLEVFAIESMNKLPGPLVIFTLGNTAGMLPQITLNNWQQTLTSFPAGIQTTVNQTKGPDFITAADAFYHDQWWVFGITYVNRGTGLQAGVNLRINFTAASTPAVDFNCASGLVEDLMVIPVDSTLRDALPFL